MFGWKSGSRGNDDTGHRTTSTHFNTSSDTGSSANSVSGWGGPSLSSTSTSYFASSSGTGNGASGISGWKLFGKSSSSTLSPHQSLPGDQYPEVSVF